MRRHNKSWRQFPVKDTKSREADCMRIRKICGLLFVVEALILWQQDQIPGIRVNRQQESGMEQMQQEDSTMLEQILGIRLRIEEGVIEFFCVKEEKR